MIAQESSSKSESELAEEAYTRATKLLREIHKDDVDYAKKLSDALGQNILHEDLGAFSDPLKRVEPYRLDGDTKDRLIAHTRQDVASTYGLATQIMTFQEKLKGSISSLRNLVWLCVCMQLVTLYFIVWGN
ncbi:hypothetical protein [Paragemmobacter aquarius]|uniref:hypothetical protein n=1 Tax=Paragemmobacter aquarius TaxID=2169400 RepID=UPI00131F0D60|nr:hypothetical protein [Gemmobacter aquarius]